MSNAIALKAVAVLVLLPSTLVAGFFSLMGVAFVTDSLRHGDRVAAGFFLVAAMVAGWFGLITSWRLYYRLLRGRGDFSHRIAWAGLACGCLASIGLIATTGGALGFRWVFLGWPLIAAGYLALALRRRSQAT